jgi:hypothetical protein
VREEDYLNVLLTLEQLREELVGQYGEDFLSEMDIVIFEINNSKELNADQIMALFLLYVF